MNATGHGESGVTLTFGTAYCGSTTTVSAPGLKPVPIPA
jgi:hypothetical protein